MKRDAEITATRRDMGIVVKWGEEREGDRRVGTRGYKLVTDEDLAMLSLLRHCRA